MFLHKRGIGLIRLMKPKREEEVDILISEAARERGGRVFPGQWPGGQPQAGLSEGTCLTGSHRRQAPRSQPGSADESLGPRRPWSYAEGATVASGRSARSLGGAHSPAGRQDQRCS